MGRKTPWGRVLGSLCQYLRKLHATLNSWHQVRCLHPCITPLVKGSISINCLLVLPVPFLCSCFVPTVFWTGVLPGFPHHQSSQGAESQYLLSLVGPSLWLQSCLPFKCLPLCSGSLLIKFSICFLLQLLDLPRLPPRITQPLCPTGGQTECSSVGGRHVGWDGWVGAGSSMWGGHQGEVLQERLHVGRGDYQEQSVVTLPGWAQGSVGFLTDDCFDVVCS